MFHNPEFRSSPLRLGGFRPSRRPGKSWNYKRVNIYTQNKVSHMSHPFGGQWYTTKRVNKKRGLKPPNRPRTSWSIFFFSLTLTTTNYNSIWKKIIITNSKIIIFYGNYLVFKNLCNNINIVLYTSSSWLLNDLVLSIFVQCFNHWEEKLYLS